MIKKRKITIIGAGNVGTTLAQRIAEEELGDIVLLDIVPDMPKGKALDLMQSGPVIGYNTRITGTNSYEDTGGSDIIVITSGVPRKPGMSRDDLLRTNFEIVKGVTEQVINFSPDAIIIVVSNPLDVMTYTAWKHSGFPSNRVIGMAGILDAARFKTFISMELNISIKSIDTFVLGGHGDTMVPLLGYTRAGGRLLSELLPKERVNSLVQRTRDGGAEIVGYLKTGSAYYAPSAATLAMVKAIILDTREIFCCSVMPDGEYGLRDTYVGLPVRLGRTGAEKIVELYLDDNEKNELNTSVSKVNEMIDLIREH